MFIFSSQDLSSLFSNNVHLLFPDNEFPQIAKERLRLGQVINLFGGVEVSWTFA